MATEGFKRKLAAILGADRVGYSHLMGEDEASIVTDDAPGYHSTRRAGRQTVKTLLRAAGLLALLLMAAGTARALDNSDCFACHSDKELTKTNKAGKVVSLFVDEKEYGASIHGKNLCTSCHAEITEVPHPDGYTHKPVACSACHRVETDIYLKSDHGQAVAKGESEAASCKDCHGHSHTLLNYRNPRSPVNHANIPQTCGRCHGNTAEMEKFNLCPARASRDVRPQRARRGVGETRCHAGGGLHGLSRVARSAQVHQPGLEALLAEHSRHVRQVSR